ncbi:hypothetical protein [Oleiagrimonas soli]|uniref:Sugar lactone lactonase YvrE n=1 Tax=Oleiagrimonas soli TaxID=1543381 RepID=A0A099CV85_9GAMM|nr:hypothetical protein [Oleiagrimonas soli]KGI76935.1 hypothetical protein LF63_0113550 [Oleiagrimonas soli]MBB6185196.1 sugar lactone lactonase YvrE [Oleiagrimonas soli]
MSQQGTPRWKVTPQPGNQINSTDISADGGICLLGTSQEYGTGQFAVFCFNRISQQRWSDPLPSTTYQGVFWVAVSVDGRYGAAGGTQSQTASSAGFLRAYAMENGTRLLDESLPSRVNQVALSDAGERLVAVAGDSLYVYDLRGDGYARLAQPSFAGEYCRTCAISADGRRIVVGTSINSDSDDAESCFRWSRDTDGSDAGGAVHVFDIDDRQLQAHATSRTDAGIMHVAMLPNGSCWVASRHDGQAMAFTADVSLSDGTPAWIYAPAGIALDVAYGIAVAETEDGEVRVVCGANLQDTAKDRGCLYAVRSQREPGDTPSYTPTPLWQHTLAHDPNPGINMDRKAQWVTATDGQPDGGTSESKGNFYLFAAGSGRLAWQYTTSLMNWPMAIAADGHAVFGGSDDGSAYYWMLI